MLAQPADFAHVTSIAESSLSAFEAVVTVHTYLFDGKTKYVVKFTAA